MPQVVFEAPPAHVLVDALEGFTEAEQGDLDGTVQDTPAELPGQQGAWRLVDTALADVPAVLAALGRAQGELEAVRLDRANLLAAIRATLAADAEGEHDPFGYLRDELDSHSALAATGRRG